ncbi:Uncharacterized protein APZ42_011625 [Daphnia magna]|uniref:Uncharacterized protein n=1 Tax=Daphnia magna TaxID=35525 RepID=A0A162SV20_9CRUS|nr:Uncharacterized protein APZ42_011625 [Daphnia magna]
MIRGSRQVGWLFIFFLIFYYNFFVFKLLLEIRYRLWHHLSVYRHQTRVFPWRSKQKSGNRISDVGKPIEKQALRLKKTKNKKQKIGREMDR